MDTYLESSIQLCLSLLLLVLLEDLGTLHRIGDLSVGSHLVQFTLNSISQEDGMRRYHSFILESGCEGRFTVYWLKGSCRCFLARYVDAVDVSPLQLPKNHSSSRGRHLFGPRISELPRLPLISDTRLVLAMHRMRVDPRS